MYANVGSAKQSKTMQEEQQQMLPATLFPSSTAYVCSANIKQKLEETDANSKSRLDSRSLKNVGDARGASMPLRNFRVDKCTSLSVLGQPDDIDAVTIYSQDSDGDTLLHTAIILDETYSSLSFILKAPTHEWLSFKNHLFQSPLHLAAMVNQPEVVRKLVVAGAEVTSQDKDGNTALHIACRNGNLSVITSLIQPVQQNETSQIKYKTSYRNIPQDLSIRNYDGLSCLHLAAMKGHLDIVDLLINNNPDIINITDAKSGRTVLHNACAAGETDLVRLLLRNKNCDINARAFDDYTPFDLARARGHELICTALAAAGASKTV